MNPAKRVVESFDGIPIRYDVHGTGSPALVFVHGALCRRSQWDAQMSHFASNHTVVAIDLAGHGESGTGRRSWTMGAFGEDVVAVIRELDVDHVMIIGHSMGGFAMLEAATFEPDRVAGLVGVDTFRGIEAEPDPNRAKAILDPLRSDFAQAVAQGVKARFLPDSDSALVKRVTDDVMAMDPNAGVGEYEELLQYGSRLRQVLRELKPPVAVIASDWRPFDVAEADRYGVDVHFVSGTGHWPMMEKPTEFNVLLEGCVARMSGIVANLQNREA